MSEESIQQAFSWTIISHKKIVKQIDKSVVFYKTTGIPVEIRWFFDLDQFKPGDKQEITLLFEGKFHEATFSMGVQDLPRSRMTWRSDFAHVIQKKFQSYYDEWKKSDEEPEEVGCIIFEKKSSELYEVFLHQG